jgi:hypothetical protein
MSEIASEAISPNDNIVFPRFWRQRMRAPKAHFLLVLAIFIAAQAPAVAQGSGETKSLALRGVAVTGINRVVGKPVFDFGPPHGTVGFFTIGAYNPNGPSPLVLTQDSPPSTVLASAMDLGLLDVFGVKPEEVNPAHLNIPLRDIPAIFNSAGVKHPLRDHRAAAQMESSRSVSVGGPITLGQWLAASGTGSITCPPKFAPKVDLSMEGLIPHGLYTVWGGMLTALGPRPVALGGVPNAFVADEEGHARFVARLNYCPLALRDGELPLSFIDILFHPDQSLYGTVGNLTLAGYPNGVVTQIQVEFPVSVTLLRD